MRWWYGPYGLQGTLNTLCECHRHLFPKAMECALSEYVYIYAWVFCILLKVFLDSIKLYVVRLVELFSVWYPGVWLNLLLESKLAPSSRRCYRSFLFVSLFLVHCLIHLHTAVSFIGCFLSSYRYYSWITIYEYSSTKQMHCVCEHMIGCAESTSLSASHETPTLNPATCTPPHTTLLPSSLCSYH